MPTINELEREKEDLIEHLRDLQIQARAAKSNLICVIGKIHLLKNNGEQHSGTEDS